MLGNSWRSRRNSLLLFRKGLEMFPEKRLIVLTLNISWKVYAVYYMLIHNNLFYKGENQQEGEEEEDDDDNILLPRICRNGLMYGPIAQQNVSS